MQVPGNMTTPRMKLAEGEEVERVQQGMRKKGIFGNRFGELYVTNQRVAFVKAIMKSGVISAAANKMGAKPMVAFERGAIVSAEKQQLKKMSALVVSDGSKTERFVIEEAVIDELLASLGKA